jgi:hypothetical protein
MGDNKYRFLSAYSNISRYSRMFVVLLALLGIFAGLGYGQTATAVTASVTSDICLIYNAVHSVIFILGIAMVILGGALYAGAHVMPGTSKGTIQGYAMGFILGGVVGVVIAIMAPYIISIIVGQSASSITTTCG